jgi:hypothetical protein
MASLPPVELECRNGHAFDTTAKAEQSIPCPVCKASGKNVSVWIGKYVRSRPRAVSPRVVAQRVNGNPPAVAARSRQVPLATRRVAAAEVEPWRPSPEEVERFVLGFDVMRRPRADVLEPTSVIAPDRPPVVQDQRQHQPDLSGKQPVAAQLIDRLRGGRRARGPRLSPGERLQLTRWCDLCQLDRKGTEARYQAEIPQIVELCGRCLLALWRESPKEIVVARRIQVLADGSAQPGDDVLLLRLARSGVHVPGLATLAGA